jgi:hypothetical protein
MAGGLIPNATGFAPHLENLAEVVDVVVVQPHPLIPERCARCRGEGMVELDHDTLVEWITCPVCWGGVER